MTLRSTTLALMLMSSASLSAQQADRGALTLGRLHYDGGGDWYANPSSLPNLLSAIRERTTMRTAQRERPVRVTDPELWDVPYLYATGHSNIRFTDDEVKTLRRWVL